MIVEPASDKSDPLDPDLIADMYISLGMNLDRLEGKRVYPQGSRTRIDVWGMDGYSLDCFVKGTPVNMQGGWQISRFKLARSNIRHVTISGLEVTTNDQEVERYFQMFGVKMITKEARYCTFKTGKWRGKNGDRTYLMHLRDTTAPLGTFHLIDNVCVRIQYRNCIPTCGRFYSTPDFCLGARYGRKCYEEGGHKIKHSEHVKWLKEEHIRRKEIKKNITVENIDEEISETINPEVCKPVVLVDESNCTINTSCRLKQMKIPDLMMKSVEIRTDNEDDKEKELVENKEETIDKKAEKKHKLDTG